MGLYSKRPSSKKLTSLVMFLLIPRALSDNPLPSFIYPSATLTVNYLDTVDVSWTSTFDFTDLDLNCGQGPDIVLYQSTGFNPSRRLGSYTVSAIGMGFVTNAAITSWPATCTFTISSAGTSWLVATGGEFVLTFNPQQATTEWSPNLITTLTASQTTPTESSAISAPIPPSTFDRSSVKSASPTQSSTPATSSAAPSSTPTPTPNSHPLSTGAKAGIAIGSVLGALSIGLFGWLLTTRRRRKAAAERRPMLETFAAPDTGIGFTNKSELHDQSLESEPADFSTQRRTDLDGAIPLMDRSKEQEQESSPHEMPTSECK